MSEEKILDNEILDDEDLEGVAGGTIKETVDDKEKLSKLGLYNYDKSKSFDDSLKEGFDALGKKIGLDVKCDSSLSIITANVYQIGNQTLTREQFWNTVNRLMPKKQLIGLSEF